MDMPPYEEKKMKERDFSIHAQKGVHGFIKRDEEAKKMRRQREMGPIDMPSKNDIDNHY